MHLPHFLRRVIGRSRIPCSGPSPGCYRHWQSCVSREEMQVLGGDTPAWLEAAADGYLRAHPGDYPTFVGLGELRWAERVGP